MTAFEVAWKPELNKIVAARKSIQAEGYELTPCGPQPIKQPATFLETFHEFRIFKDPAKALLDESNFKWMIPMKPFFYDLAYDLLEPPQL